MANQRSDRPAPASSEGGRLAGQRTVVTGASSGIGRAIALRFAAEGADVAVTFRRSEDAAEQVASQIRQMGRRALVLHADLAEADDIDWVAERAFSEWSRIDTWVNNAGADILTGAGARLSERDKLDRLLAVDLRGTVLLSWRVAERMREQPGGGSILNMSWDHVGTGMEGRNPEMFSAAKGGILSFSKSLARSVAPEVRVNILAPGWIATAFAEEQDPDAHRRIAEQTPLRRWGRPEDVAEAAVYLASPGAEFLTGITLPISGGIIM